MRGGRRPSGYETLSTCRTLSGDTTDDLASRSTTWAALGRGDHPPRFGNLAQRLERASSRRRLQRSYHLGEALHRKALSTSAGWWGVAGLRRGGGCAWAGATPDPSWEDSCSHLLTPNCEKRLRRTGEMKGGHAPRPSVNNRLVRFPEVLPFHSSDRHFTSRRTEEGEHPPWRQLRSKSQVNLSQMPHPGGGI